MNFSAEPILDIARGLSTIASLSIVFNQFKYIYMDFFIKPCAQCRGAGCLICKHCKGTKVRRITPEELGTDERLERECLYCGPYLLNDTKYENVSDDKEILNIMANLKAGMLNRPRPFLHKPAAGTVPCNMCYGKATIHNYSPDIEKFLNITPSWDQMIALRVDYTNFAYPKPGFVEYPRGPPVKMEPVPKKPAQIKGLDGQDLDKVVLPYIDDSDTSDEEEGGRRRIWKIKKKKKNCKIRRTKKGKFLDGIKFNFEEEEKRDREEELEDQLISKSGRNRFATMSFFSRRNLKGRNNYKNSY